MITGGQAMPRQTESLRRSSSRSACSRAPHRSEKCRYERVDSNRVFARSDRPRPHDIITLVPSIRHLSPDQLSGAFRRNGQIEQLLALETMPDGQAVVRWLVVSRAGRELQLRIHAVEDVGSFEFADVSEFPSVNPDEEFGEGVVVASGEDLEELLAIAEAHGASRDRWVNAGIIGQEYLDARES